MVQPEPGRSPRATLGLPLMYLGDAAPSVATLETGIGFHERVLFRQRQWCDVVLCGAEEGGLGRCAVFRPPALAEVSLWTGGPCGLVGLPSTLGCAAHAAWFGRPPGGDAFLLLCGCCFIIWRSGLVATVGGFRKRD